MTREEILELAHRRATKYWHHGLNTQFDYDPLLRYGFKDYHMVDFVREIQNKVLDEAIEAVKLGIARDGHDTTHYQQSMKHIKDLEELKENR